MVSLVFSYSQNFNRFLREGKLITLTKHNPQIQFLYLTDTRGEISWLWGGDGSSLLMAICLKEVAVICSWFSLASLYLGLWSPGSQTAVRVVWDRKNTLVSRQGCVEGPWRMWVCKASREGRYSSTRNVPRVCVFPTVFRWSGLVIAAPNQTEVRCFWKERKRKTLQHILVFIRMELNISCSMDLFLITDLHCPRECSHFPEPCSVLEHTGWVEFYSQAFQYPGLRVVWKVTGGHISSCWYWYCSVESLRLEECKWTLSIILI